MQYVTFAIQDRGGEIDLATFPCKLITADDVEELLTDAATIFENTVVGVTVNVYNKRVAMRQYNPTDLAALNTLWEAEYPIGITGNYYVVDETDDPPDISRQPFNMLGVRGEAAHPDALLDVFLKKYACLDGVAVTNVEQIRTYSMAGLKKIS